MLNYYSKTIPKLKFAVELIDQSNGDITRLITTKLTAKEGVEAKRDDLNTYK